MSWSDWKSDQILDNFKDSPGSATIVGPSLTGRGMLTTDMANDAATAIRRRAVDRGMNVVVTVRRAEDHPGHSEVVVLHIPDTGSQPS